MDPFAVFEPVRRWWASIPGQLKRLPVLLALFVVALVVVRMHYVPDDFGELGHYRASGLARNADRPLHYAGHVICAECHENETGLKQTGYHKNLSCEICHGPALDHTDSPDEVTPRAPRGRGYCPLCHEYLPSRPTGFPQIVAASHNPRKPCIACHDPHDPKPLHTPEECEACHATIARTKALSDHVYVPCTRCHNAPEAHKTDPRRNPPSRPQTRAFCGACHATSGPDSRDVKQIDLTTHGEHYVCWQCHYPHLPEVH